MCGINGYIGQDNAIDILLTGLKRLEYRGYDSTGIALATADGHHIFKTVGPTHFLKTAQMDAKVGIGHVRWATKGQVTTTNAHPHQSANGRFTMVHNGMLENEQYVRETYLQHYPFATTCDSEVIVALLQVLVDQYEDVQMAIRKLLTICEGAYALAVLDVTEPDQLIGIRNNSPLVVGHGKNGYTLSSDISSMTHVCHNFFQLKDKEFVFLTAESCKVYNESGMPLAIENFTVQETGYERLSHFSHYMEQEIHDIPATIKRMKQLYEKDNWDGRLTYIFKKLKEAKKLYFVASGTSYHAATIGKQYLQHKVQVEMNTLDEFYFDPCPIDRDAVYLISCTTGESYDGLKALQKVEQNGGTAILISNHLNGTVTRQAKYVLPLLASKEIAVCETATFVAQLVLYLYMSQHLGDDFALDLQLEKAIHAINHILAEKKSLEKAAQKLASSNKIFVVGRGLDGLTAKYGAEILAKLTYVGTFGLPAGELKYGALSLIDPEDTVIVLNSYAHTKQAMEMTVDVVKTRLAHVLPLEQDAVHDQLAPIVSGVALMLLAYYAGKIKGHDVDRPRHLAKL